MLSWEKLRASKAVETAVLVNEDDSVEVRYLDGSRLKLSPCGCEFVFEKALNSSAHPLEQPERIRQRTQFVTSSYREQLLQALDFRNAFSTCPFLPDSIIPSERKQCIFLDVFEVTWPSLDAVGTLLCMDNDNVKISSLDGYASLYLPKTLQEFTVHFLCKVSQKCDSSLGLSEKSVNNQIKEDNQRTTSSPKCTFGLLKAQKMKTKENESKMSGLKPKELMEAKNCISMTEDWDEVPWPYTKSSSVYVWVKQFWSVASCPAEWKYPLSLALSFMKAVEVNKTSKTDTEVKLTMVSGPGFSREGEKEIRVSILPKALPLSCPAPHLHRWSFSDLPWEKKHNEQQFSCLELVKIIWYQGITFRLTHGIVNSIEIYPGDGSVFKSEGAVLGSYFTSFLIQEGLQQREERIYSVNNLPPDVPGSSYSVSSVIKQAVRILQYCAKIKLSLSHIHSLCCWKMNQKSGTDERELLPTILSETFIPGIGRFVAYSDDKVHAIFLEGITLTLIWDFHSYSGKTQMNQDVTTGWCKVTLPDGQDQLINIEHPGQYGRYVTTAIAWCRNLTHLSRNDMVVHPVCPTIEENWSVAAELEKIQRFNFLLENNSVLNQVSAVRKNQSSGSFQQRPLETCNALEEVSEKSVSAALKRTSEVLQGIDFFLATSRK